MTPAQSETVGFWRGVFSDRDGPSSTRVWMIFSGIATLLWISYYIHSTGKFPENGTLLTLVGYIGGPYGANKFSSEFGGKG